MRWDFAMALAAALFFAGSTQAAEAPPVVVSIKPIHSLVAAVMQGVGAPDLIVDGAASPHSFTLKPSNARRLEAAKLVFWIGPGMETFLEKPLALLSDGAKLIRLDSADRLVKLPLREGGTFEAHDHDHHDEHDHAGSTGHDDAKHEHAADDPSAQDGAAQDGAAHDETAHDEDEHDHGGFDNHLWLDPMNAKAMTVTIVDALVAADPANAERYRANGTALERRLDDLDGELAATLAPIKTKPFIVFHDAYQYFENRYGLTVSGSITVTPDVIPGAARVAEIHHKVEELGATCVFAEPQFEPKLISVVTEGTMARSGTLDPEAATLTPSPDLYFQLMRAIAANLKTCLSRDA